MGRLRPDSSATLLGKELLYGPGGGAFSDEGGTPVQSQEMEACAPLSPSVLKMKIALTFLRRHSVGRSACTGIPRNRCSDTGVLCSSQKQGF